MGSNTRNATECLMPGCAKPAETRGLCGTHYAWRVGSKAHREMFEAHALPPTRPGKRKPARAETDDDDLGDEADGGDEVNPDDNTPAERAQRERVNKRFGLEGEAAGTVAADVPHATHVETVIATVCTVCLELGIGRPDLDEDRGERTFSHNGRAVMLDADGGVHRVTRAVSPALDVFG